jgi:hypothetical protein
MDVHGLNACKYLKFEKYDWKTDRQEPTIFWLYFAEDYKLLANHTGKRYIFWNGSDVRRLISSIQGEPQFALTYVPILRDTSVVHACQSSQLRNELALLGIHAVIRPMFYGDVNKYELQSDLTKDCYMTANKGRGFEYGEGLMNAIAWQFPEWTFHIFGIDPTVSTYCENLKYYGWIHEDEMDSITNKFAVCLRFNEHDGFSQTVMKAIMRGHIPITTIDFGNLTLYCKSYNHITDVFRHYNRIYNFHYSI